MFTHLHLHSEYSLLDAVSQIPDLVTKIKDSGMEACALTDHGNLYGAYKFLQEMRAAELKPIIGCEMYIAPRTMQDKQHGIDNKYYHLVLLAKNLEGYKNLMKIVSLGHVEGFYYKPRVDFETLSKYSEGLIATTACLGGILSRPLLNRNKKLAIEHLKKYKDLFGEDFYIEIQRNGIPEQKKVNKQLLELADEYEVPIVAACDSHYLNKEDAELQEILWAIAEGRTMDDPDRRQMETNEFYIKTPEEMKELFKDLPEAIDNTQKIADKVEEYDITWGRAEPEYHKCPEGESPKSYLKKLTYEGVKEKYGELTEDLKERVDYELKIIDDKGYNDYFLIVRDMTKFCRDNNIVTGMRGSGCGSVVAYAIGITHVEPLDWNLYFERFLNYERASPPDFDIDVADDRRQELIDYTLEEFGEDNVSKIGTFSKLQTRQAIRDVSRVLDINAAVADKLSKMVDVVFGKAKSIDYMMENNAEFNKIVSSYPDLQKMTNIVKRINGVCRGVSTHACGFIVSPEPVMNYCPIQRDSDGEGIDMTQFEMGDAEAIGLMKFDFLGLRNLAVLGQTIAKVKEKEKGDIDLLDIDFEDEEVFKTIRDGHTVGIFQMESPGMRQVIGQIKPQDLEEVCYLLAAYRPGPMEFIPDYVAVKEGRKEPDYIIDDLKPILEVTNGVITYQEQIMRIVQVLAGYSLGEASVVMKAMSKKKMKKVKKEKPQFIKGGLEKGYDKEDLEEVWSRLLKFANYGFNKAHSSSYAHVAYWTAYLKTHYPLEYMASLLEADLGNFDRVVKDLRECKRLGIEVLPLSINNSYQTFRSEGESGIRIGLASIKGINSKAIESIVTTREEEGLHFNNLAHVLEKVDLTEIPVKNFELLIKVGAFDEFGDRKAHLEVLPDLYERYKNKQIKASMGQNGLFVAKHKHQESVPNLTLPQGIPTSDTQKIKWENELIGIYVTKHPLSCAVGFCERFSIKSTEEISADNVGKSILVLGVIKNVKKITTKNGKRMAFLTIEDMYGAGEVVIFPKLFKSKEEILSTGNIVVIKGKVNERNGDHSILANKIKVVTEQQMKKYSKEDSEEGEKDLEKKVVFNLEANTPKEKLQELKQEIKENAGEISAILCIDCGNKKVKKDLGCKIKPGKWMEKYKAELC